MNTQKGFSLIELMVAIVIIGILIATTTIGISKSQQHTRNTQRIGDVTLISKAIDQVSIQNGVYPTVDKCLSAPNCGDQTIIGRNVDNGTSPLSKIDASVFPSGKIPGDPKPALTYKTNVATATTGPDAISRWNSEKSKNILAGYYYSVNSNWIGSNTPAEKLNTYYAIEVGLEEGNVDEFQIQRSDELGLDTLIPLARYKVETTVTNPLQAYETGKGTRYRYLILGSSCGVNGENCPK